MLNMDKIFIPISYLNAYIYCPRRFFLEFNRGMFEDNQHTVEGRTKHKLLDTGNARPRKKEDYIHRRSVWLSSEKLSIIGRLDLLEEDKSDNVYPVEYKKGKKPPPGKEPWLNDKIQLCAQCLLLQDNGLPLPSYAYLYYISSRARIKIKIDLELIEQTKEAIRKCLEIANADQIPPLTENRNKCFGCSLNAICLPEEEDVLKQKKPNAKIILPLSLDGELLYVDRPGAYLSLCADQIQVIAPDKEILRSVNLENLREIVLCGPAQATTQTLHACLKRGIYVHYLNYYSKYIGSFLSLNNYHGLLREGQWKAHFDKNKCLEIAKKIVLAKAKNMRTLMNRWTRDNRTEAQSKILYQVKQLLKKINKVTELNSLRGIEGTLTKIYFSFYTTFIKPEKQKFFYFQRRNRRPPQDPVNALLSFGYSLLTKDCLAIAVRVGLDPYCGFYHVMKYGRPSLALDIMECFRQPIVDSVVISSINNGIFKNNDFYQYQKVCYLNEKGRKKFVVHYEMRKKDMVSHPKFHYRMSYARMIELQYRLLGKYLLGDIDSFEGFYIR